jgi:hypothetical protein
MRPCIAATRVGPAPIDAALSDERFLVLGEGDELAEVVWIARPDAS